MYLLAKMLPLLMHHLIRGIDYGSIEANVAVVGAVFGHGYLDLL